jgi:hypothetical protein
MEIIGIRIDKSTLKKLEEKIKLQTTEMENCLTDFGDPTCYELFRTDNEVIWIRFDHEDNKIEIIREEQS